jgi:hypothetical protein
VMVRPWLSIRRGAGLSFTRPGMMSGTISGRVATC